MNAARNFFWKQGLGLAGAVLLALIFCPEVRGEQTLSLAWNASKDKQVTGYYLHYGTASSNYTARINVAKKKPSLTVPGLKEGMTYYFAVTSYDSQGVESQPSKEISYIVPGVLALDERINPGDPARIKFPVAPKHKYQIQASDDMRTWVTIGQVKGAANEWVEFDDAAAAQHHQRFYRLVLR
jgi:hypothetical protein